MDHHNRPNHSSAPLTEEQKGLIERITRRRWHQRYRSGETARVAAEDTIVFMTLFGRAYFNESVRILRSHNLIRQNVNLLYGGWCNVAMLRIPPEQRGEVIEVPARLLPTEFLLRVEPSIYAAAEDVPSFLQEIRTIVNDPYSGGDHNPLDVLRLPREKLGQVLKDGDEATCAVCQEELKHDEQVVVLNCKHWFCVECTNSWLSVKDTCPMCRGKVELPDASDSDMPPELPFFYDDEEGEFYF
ncbi:RING finger protein [Penicillium malachiteum]|uniref:RING finger protein n=1 Tax=Penicillium malachiteum TaxID=1324776 RepID=UPI0025488DC4|nr:RING finger protein [Penicillium malachiteum]KAJ5735065.1 RING finger protein [Penicillium malachiteum]